MGNNPVVSFDPDGGLCYDSNGNTIACPDDAIYDEYRDNKDSHITILEEVVVTPSDEVSAEVVETEEPEFVKGDKVLIDIDEEAMLAAILLTARITSQLDGPELGPGDMAAAGEVLSGLALLSLLQQMADFVNTNQATIESLFNAASDSSKNEKHGGQGLTESEERAIADLEAQMEGVPKKVKNRLKKKVENIRRNAQKRQKGEEHSRTKKGN